MASAIDTVKETLLGVEDEPQLSAQTRAEFMQHAKKDEETGKYYLSEEDFVDAIAPTSQNYVCEARLPFHIEAILIISSTKSNDHNSPFSST